MYKVGLVFCICAFAGAVGAQVVIPVTAVFYDRSFEAVVRDALDAPVNVISDQDLATLEALDAPESNITSLEGIQHCVNLQQLNLAGNRITDLKPLADLPALAAVDLSDNRIGDISPLVLAQGFGSGDVLDLTGNPLTQASICRFVPALEERGVTVAYSGKCSPDRDGDGLSDETEAEIGTDPNLPDSDGDGIADGFEIGRGLDPMNAEDAALDSDDDGLTNLEEFHRGSDPTSAASPTPTFFVWANGDDANDGSADYPWATVGHALEKTAGYPSVNIALRTGVYIENVTLNPGTRLVGISQDVFITGHIVGANMAAVVNLDVLCGPSATVESPALLSMFDCAMLVRKVGFWGTPSRIARAIAVTGDMPAASIVSQCTFKWLRIGIDIFGAAPRIRRCSFDNISESAIVFRAVESKNYADGDGISALSDGNSGFNLFTNIDGPYVLNMRTETIDMRNNYWGTEDPEAIEDLVSGNVDTTMNLKNASTVPATVICCLWNAATMEPVTTGTIYLSPGAFTPLTENTDGVYTFACIPGGDYTVTAVASGYASKSENVSLDSGDEVSLVFPMEEGDDDPGGGGCFGATTANGRPGGGGFALMAVGAVLFFACLSNRARTLPGSAK